MPYESNKQAAFMHIHHPEVAAKWREAGHGYVKGGKNDPSKKKGRIRKAKAATWAKPVVVGTATGTVGGALANQFPSWEQRQARKRKRGKGQIKKMLITSDDPYFNTQAAQKTFDLIMKMDDDTAQMFCHVVASDLLEREVEENRVTLQKHLNEVIAKRRAVVKAAFLRAVSKGLDDPVPYAQALSLIEAEISKADDIPNWEFERKIKRDQSTGRFQMKVNRESPAKKPIPDGTAKALGIEGTDDTRYRRMSPKERADYQHQYQQVADFLRATHAATGGPGNAKVLVHFRNDSTGETWADQHTGGKPPHTSMLPKHVNVIGVEAQPEQLTHGGAAFSLAGAMGQTMGSQQVGAINTAQAESPQWTKDWVEAGNNEYSTSHARLYGRTAKLGQIAGTLAPPGSKVQLAGQLAEVVGQYGPQAENVLGPSARKTAYRYRGTEKTPDKRLARMYDQAIVENKKAGPIDIWGEREESKLRRARGAGKQPFGSETAVRAKGSYRRTVKPEDTPSLTQLVAQREAMAGRAPEWQEREMGRHAVQQYLVDQLPSKQYYKLQLASGNTPPSEGVILNSEGQIVTQAVGYGDDHYLPFNLKNLKGLKGGEYIRNRSVGGLTSEDIYTGLISGARRVTVVSRSGTFTMEFQPDFRGGRRHNDKARRMTRRYEHILDAVQSEQVERQDVPTRWKKIIEAEVRGEYGPSASQRLVRSEIDARINEFKKNPQIDGRDLDRAEAEISRFEEREKRGEVSRQDVVDYRKEVMSELRDLKEIHFRLNGVGYTAALDALEEQFPYYIHSMSRPKEEHLEEFERDLGYVEPARNRPTAADAGWFGTRKEESGKYSAAYADYQRGLPGTPEPHGHPREKGKYANTGVTGSTATSAGGGGSGRGVVRTEREQARDRAAEALEQSQANERVITAGVALQQAVVMGRHPAPAGSPTPEWWGYDDNQIREYLDDPTKRRKFTADVESIGDKWDATDMSRHWQAFRTARSRSGGGTEYGAAHTMTWQTSPYKFSTQTHEAYRPSPERGAVEGEIRNIDGQDASLKFDRPLSALSERELREEFDLSKNVAGAMKTAKLNGDAAQDALGGQFKNPSAGYASQFFREKGAEAHLENIHKMRHLRAKQNWNTNGVPPAPPTGGSSAGPGPVGGQPAQPSPPAPPGSDPEDLKLFSEYKSGWVKAAKSVQAQQPQDTDALDQFIQRMNSLPADASYEQQDMILETLPGDLHTHVHNMRGRQLSV